MRWTNDRLGELKRLVHKRIPFRQIGRHFGMSGPAAWQAAVRYGILEVSTEAKSTVALKDEFDKRIASLVRRGIPTDALVDVDAYQFYLATRAIFNSKRGNARRIGIQFSIKFEEVKWPQTCPVFGVQLDYYGEGMTTDNAPSFDRMDPRKGYVPGNVQIISNRANRIKNDASIAELQQIIRYMAGVNGRPKIVLRR